MLFGLSLFEINQDPYRLTSHMMAANVTFRQGAWWAGSGWVQQFPAPGQVTRTAFTERRLDLAAPQHFSGAHDNQTDLMTFGELRAQIATLSASGINLAESRVKLHSRVAFPIVAIVMTILGIPFGATTGRRGTLYGVGLAIILGASYWLLSTFFLAAGQADLLSPWLAAWAANVIFVAMAGYLLFTVRT
jgi:lipopolysaccharide export system permease protein